MGTEVSASNGSAVELGVSTGVTLSYETPDLMGGFFGQQASASFVREVEHTIGTDTTTTYGKSYSGGWDADQVVFQGTLYQVYEYEVVAAPDKNAVGTHMTIDEPVDTKTYSWSRPLLRCDRE